MLCDPLLKFTREAMASSDTEELAITQVDEGIICLAKPRGRLDERIEHSPEIEGRATDDLEHVGGGSLLLTRFVELARELGHIFLFGVRVFPFRNQVLLSARMARRGPPRPRRSCGCPLLTVLGHAWATRR